MSEIPRGGRVAVVSFYRFAELSDLEGMKSSLLDVSSRNGVNGTFILSGEGINASVAGPPEGIGELIAFVESRPALAGGGYRIARHSKSPFHRLKVKFKKELVPMGVRGIGVPGRVGEYVPAEEWNGILRDPGVLVVDARNDYECRVGTFRGAVNPGTANFREFPRYADENLDPRRHEKVAMFCTGGIRCEKATAYLLQKGFRSVYHLRGGILSYLERVPERESLWEGECFVFDDRTSVVHGLGKGTWTTCRNCRSPLCAKDRESGLFRDGVSCPRCHGSLTPRRIASLEERRKQMRLAEERNTRHLGAFVRRGRAAG